MDANAISTEIQRLRHRLKEIEETRGSLPAEEFEQRALLIDEEHELEARLAVLRDEASAALMGIAE